MANFISFREALLPIGAFTIYQAEAFSNGVDRSTITRWVSKGYLIRLRRGLYTFPELTQSANFNLFLSSVIYSPSYISTHYALAFYDIIPEAVTEITAVSTMKTATFRNKTGNYSYNSISKSLFWGYELRNLPDGKSFGLATPEKALIDLLHLYPFYKTEEDMIELRLDENFMEEDLNTERMGQYLAKAHSKTLCKRMETVFNAYGLSPLLIKV